MMFFFYLKMFVLLYADDTVIFATDEKTLQHNVNTFYEYSVLWKLDINYEILVFWTRNDDRFDFKI